MYRFITLLILLAAPVHSPGASCAVIFAEMVEHYPHGWHNYMPHFMRDAEALVRAIKEGGPELPSRHPHLDEDKLRTILEFAFENAGAHGSSGSGSKIRFSVTEETDGFIHVRIRNPKISEFPPHLKGVVFTPTSETQKVPDDQRHVGNAHDRSGGLGSNGLPRMIGALKYLVQNRWPVTGAPTMEWREVEAEGAAFVEFELKLPLSTRVLKDPNAERLRRQSPPP